MRLLRALIVLLAIVGASGTSAAAQDAPSDSDRVQSLVQPSIVFLRTTYSAPVRNTQAGNRGVLFGGDAVSAASRCTGFFVHPDGYVATAGHCVAVDQGAREAIIDEASVRALREGIFVDGTSPEDAVEYGRRYFRLAGPVKVEYLVAYPTTSSTVSTDEAVGARRIGFRAFEQGDIGLLKFETGGVAMPGLELSSEADVQVGSRIIAVGFPGSVDQVTDADYNPTFASGDIQRIGTTGGRSVEVYQHGAAVSGGMSGGPVVDEDGQVIGITSFGIRGETEAFNYATPVALLREVLVDKGVENQTGPVGETYREGVEALYDGSRGTALDRFDEVLKFPGNPVLSLTPALRTRANELPEEGLPWLWIAIVAALVALGVLVVVGIARSRSGPRPTVTPAYVGGASPSAALAQHAPPQLPVVPTPAEPAPSGSTLPAAETGIPALVAVGARGETAVRHRLEGELVIGREGEIMLSDETVSRRHAVIRVSNGRVELEDLGSANGTEVNGQRLTGTTTLAHGDKILLGATELTLDLPPAMRNVGGETVIRPRES